MHNERVLSTIPAGKLLLLRTDQISERAFAVASFAGLPIGAVRRERSRAFQNPQKLGLLQKLDPNHLHSKVELHCKPLMDRFFPDIQIGENKADQ